MTVVAAEPRTHADDPFITKVLPPKRPFGLVRRERLIRMLARAMERHRVATITAPAGYGKTSLVADLLADVSAPVCWYSVDPEDNDVRSFVHYLISALRQQFPDFGEGILHLLNASADPRSELANLTAMLVSDIQQRIDDWFILVLEDLHWLDHPDVLSTLNLFLRHLPENCFLFLTSRTRLPLGALSRLSAQRALTRITNQDLAFTEDEVLDLLAASGQAPDSATARRLTEESEGWAAGIILLAPWLDKPALLGSLGPETNREELFWYLSEQVLQHLPERWQDLLMRSAVLHDVSADLCKEAFGFDDAEFLLKEMAESGAFVTELRDGVTFRFHALFREFLLDRASREHQPIAAWHCRVAEYYASRGRCVEALRHYLAGNDPASAVIVLEVGAPYLYQHGEWALLAKMVTTLQSEAAGAGPVLGLWQARCLVQLGEPDTALALAEAYGRALGGEASPLLLALSEITRAGALRSKGNVDGAIAAARRALDHVDSAGDDPQTLLLRAEAHHYIGAAQATARRYRDALGELRRALGLYQTLETTYHLARVHNAMGACLTQLGRYPEGIEHYEVAIEASKRLGNYAALASTLNNLGGLYVSIGAYALAQDVLRSALEAARTCANTRVEAYAMQTLGLALIGNLQLEEAARALRDALNLARRSGETVLEGRAMLALARALTLLGSNVEARNLIQDAADMIADSSMAYDRAMLGYSRGLLALYNGDAARAKEDLVEALQRFAQSGDVHWTEATSLLLAQVAYRVDDLDAATTFLQMLHATLRTDDGAAALRLEAGLAEDVLRFAAERLPEGALFARLIPDVAATRPAATSGPCSPARPLVKALSLGDFSVELNGTPLDEARGLTTKAKELLIYLLTSGRRARREELLEALWPDASASRDSSVLRTNVYRLRKVLYDQCVVVQGDSYHIDPKGLFSFDLEYFKDLIQRTSQSGCSAAERTLLLETAVNLYRGPFLNAVSSEWCVGVRNDAEEKFAGAALTLAGIYLENDNPAGALGLAERVLAIDPLNEDATLLQVRACVAMGNRPSAILHWRNYERRLEAETGGHPSFDATAQCNRLLRAS